MSKGKLSRVRHVCNLLGVSRATLSRWVDEGIFPPPVVMRRRACGRPTSIAWHTDTVMEWLLAAKTVLP